MTGGNYAALMIRAGTTFTNDGTFTQSNQTNVVGTFGGTGTFSNSGVLNIALGRDSRT